MATTENELAKPDGIRDWIDYDGHVPTLVGETTVLSATAAISGSDMLCQACGEGWPCRTALRKERNYAEDLATRRGRQMASAGVVPDNGDDGSAHPDRAKTTRGRALAAMYDEAVISGLQSVRERALLLTNVLAWHAECGPTCLGVHHDEILCMAPGAMTKDQEAQRFAQLLAEQYGAMYCNHESLPPSEQDAAIAAYVGHQFMAMAGGPKGDTFLQGDEARAEADKWPIVAYRVGFHTTLPIHTMRARLAHLEGIEIARLMERDGVEPDRGSE